MRRADLPAIDALQRELDASQQVVNLSVSLFILLAGMFPMLWSGISEIYGRKIVYLVALSLFTGSSVACSVARSPGVFLAFRLLASAGSSCGLTMGGATIVRPSPFCAAFRVESLVADSAILPLSQTLLP